LKFILSEKSFQMLRLGGLAQKSSEGRASLARGSIGFFARGAPPFFGSFFGQAKKNKKVGLKSTA